MRFIRHNAYSRLNRIHTRTHVVQTNGGGPRKVIAKIHKL